MRVDIWINFLMAMKIGTQLIKMAEKYAEEIDIHQIVFHVEKSNRSAFRLYKRLGYSIMRKENTRFCMIKKYA